MSNFGYEDIRLNWITIWRCKRCHEHSMIKFVSTHDYLIPPRCVSIPEQVWALEGCTSANFSHCILRTETKTSSAKDWRIYYMITKYFPAPWNYQMNLLVSLWFCFVLFCFHLGRIRDLMCKPEIPEKLLFIWQK